MRANACAAEPRAVTGKPLSAFERVIARRAFKSTAGNSDRRTVDRHLCSSSTPPINALLRLTEIASHRAVLVCATCQRLTSIHFFESAYPDQGRPAAAMLLAQIQIN
jgi:hypothetical protein